VSSARRIIVGASGSPGSLLASRYAQHLACDLDASLVPVLSWPPPDGDLADRRTPRQEPRRIWAQDARQRIQDALNLAWGDLPADLPVRPVIRRGQSGPVLAGAACCPGDLLVVGAGCRGAVARIGHGRVSRYCRAHARCPVLTRPAAPARPGNPPPTAGTGVPAGATRRLTTFSDHPICARISRKHTTQLDSIAKSLRGKITYGAARSSLTGGRIGASVSAAARPGPLRCRDLPTPGLAGVEKQG
jgi:nucleotide-binding universal stress UspA family protein